MIWMVRTLTPCQADAWQAMPERMHRNLLSPAQTIDGSPESALNCLIIDRLGRIAFGWEQVVSLRSHHFQYSRSSVSKRCESIT